MEPQSTEQPARTEPGPPSMSAAVEGLAGLLGGQPTLAAARGITREGLDSVYGLARELHANGHHAEALRSFELLCLYDHENARNWHALGVCRQVTQDYAGAAAALAVALGLLDDPGPGLKLSLAECLIGSGAPDDAGSVLAELAQAGDRDGLDKGERGRARLLESRLAAMRQSP